MSRSRTALALLLARVLLGVGMLAGMIGGVVAVATVWSDDPASRVVELDRDARIAEDADGARLHWVGDASITILDPSVRLALVNALPAVVLALAVAVVSALLLVVVVDVQRGVPFEAMAVRRLRACAAAVTVGAIAHPLLSAWADVEMLAAAGRPDRDLASVALERLVDVGPWLLVAALLASFAQAFNQGRRLAADTDGLV